VPTFGYSQSVLRQSPQTSKAAAHVVRNGVISAASLCSVYVTTVLPRWVEVTPSLFTLSHSFACSLLHTLLILSQQGLIDST
jgi:hypothetical protein